MPGPVSSSKNNFADAARGLGELQLREAREHVERWLARVLPSDARSPTRLHLAMREAVLLGGKRARPMLTVLVARSYPARSPDDVEEELAGRMAAAVELVHCASLVHDDLPAFDDAEVRRGHPSCHAAFGEPTAILVGDALLTLAFEAIAGAPLEHASAAMRMTRLLADGTGSRNGIIGGQGLELQTNIDLAAYHSQKTSALFRAAAAGGALAAGHVEDVARWSSFGELLGRALQLRDDLDDTTGTEEACGKPVGRDLALGRPNAVHCSSVAEVRQELGEVAAQALSLLGEPTERNAGLRHLIGIVSGGHAIPR